MIAANLNRRLEKLERQADPASAIWILMQTLDPRAGKDGDSEEAARARWLAEHPDRRAELERADTQGQVHFIRHVIVGVGDKENVK